MIKKIKIFVIRAVTHFSLDRGFSLIELLVVISIIGVLALLIVPNLIGARERARDLQLKNDLRQLASALRLYYNDYQSYPDTTTMPPVGSSFSISGTVYMDTVPQYDQYLVDNTGEYFVLVVNLTNLSDGDIANSQQKCANNLSKIDGSVEIDSSSAYLVCN